MKDTIRKAQFTFDAPGRVDVEVYEGYTDGSTWDKWAMPHFTAGEMKRMSMAIVCIYAHEDLSPEQLVESEGISAYYFVGDDGIAWAIASTIEQTPDGKMRLWEPDGLTWTEHLADVLNEEDGYEYRLSPREEDALYA